MTMEELPKRPPPPARVQILMAREARSAVVIRRGPSRKTALIGWDRRRDKFEVGQWFNGRIDERRSDLSPDGSYLIYFAITGKWRTESKGYYTAISRAPYLKAETLLAKGDTWHGGGLFVSESEYWLNDGYGHKIVRDQSKAKRTGTYPWHEFPPIGLTSLYEIRLQMDGWQRMDSGWIGRGDIVHFEKPVGLRWRLRKRVHGSRERHELLHPATGRSIAMPSWSWADVDERRLVWVESGRLFDASVDSGGLQDTRLLQDFNTFSFEKLVAPY
ncbi:hypothetical protein [Cupriavidus pauculus]|uniref:hypothetical protein n=1 Tax=Cupriavidus pauculus TaxID=82633 RepID=UPI001EE31443|nr:hypothetical protein [Cupriavidus pauculus]GJG94110.1 hypothetical protein CBA19C6_06495 [Cupriavidus pauculus]